MDQREQKALQLIETAEAELAVLKQEMVLQHLIETGEPTAQLQRLRDAVGRLLDGDCEDVAERVSDAA